MALDDIIRLGIRIANTTTDPLQEQISIRPWIGSTRGGTPSYDSAYTVKAIVKRGVKKIYDSDGSELTAEVTITILSDIISNGAEGRREPLDPRDEVTLGDGTVSPIINIGQLDDPDGGGFFYKIFLGSTSSR